MNELFQQRTVREVVNRALNIVSISDRHHEDLNLCSHFLAAVVMDIVFRLNGTHLAAVRMIWDRH